jgi:hypothetical protein
VAQALAALWARGNRIGGGIMKAFHEGLLLCLPEMQNPGQTAPDCSLVSAASLAIPGYLVWTAGQPAKLGSGADGRRKAFAIADNLRIQVEQTVSDHALELASREGDALVAEESIGH